MILHGIGVHDGPLDRRGQLDLVLQRPELGIHIIGPAIGRNRDGALPSRRLGPARCRQRQSKRDARKGNQQVLSGDPHSSYLTLYVMFMDAPS